MRTATRQQLSTLTDVLLHHIIILFIPNMEDAAELYMVILTATIIPLHGTQSIDVQNVERVMVAMGEITRDYTATVLLKQ